jgi:hypothetical protein
MVEGYILLLKLLLDLSLDSACKWESPTTEMSFQFAKLMVDKGGEVRGMWWAGNMFPAAGTQTEQ